MMTYIVALALGLLVGIFYGLLGVRAPAPPIIALVGLLGIVLGEQIPTIGKSLVGGNTLGSIAKLKSRTHPVTGDRENPSGAHIEAIKRDSE